MLEAKNSELLSAKKASDSANLAKSTFLSNMSHEIRTPLGAMIGYVDLLRRSKCLTAENGKYLEIIDRNGRTLLSLINDILDLAKVESGNLICERSSMRLPDVILDVLSTLRFSASEKGLALTAAFTSRVPVEIESDYIRLRQLLMNLVGNAIKFTTKGSVFVGIRLKPGNVGAQIEVEVVDTGCGIATDDQRRLFEPFTQGDPTISRRFGGTGLGLSLSRKLARTLGGDVYLKQSVVGEGSVFVATIDAGRFNAEAMIPPAEIDLLKSTYQERSIFQVRRSLHGIKALVVDDSPDMLLLTGTILRSAGVVVGEAMNGRDGVEKALNGEFDVLFMDVQMPILNGEEAVRELRSLGFSKPIIALTANAMVGERERVIALGFSDYLSKPVAPDRLLDAIERHTILKSSTISVETVVANDCVDRIKT